MGSIKPTKTKRRYFGKVESSLNEKLESVEWGEFNIKDLFSVNTSNKRFDANKVKISKDKNGYPYIVRQSTNNGRRGYIQESPEYLNESNTIAFGQDTATMFYQNEPYFTGDKIKILKPKFKKFNQDNAQFFLTAMEKSFSSFSWGSSSFNVKIIESQMVKIPIKDGKPDFEFMENFIAELEAERIAELEAYLEVTGLSDCELTKDEQKALDDFTNDEIEWSEFNLKDLFSVNTSNKKFDANKVKISKDKKGYPYIVRQSTNNGRRGYIQESPEYLNENNTIAFGQDTATMFYQNEPYFTGDKIKILKPKFKKFNQDNAQFFLTAMEKSFSSFSWGSSSFNVKIIENQIVKIPTNNGNPNYSLMESLISAIQKIVIKDVVKYTDAKIETHKEVIHS